MGLGPGPGAWAGGGRGRALPIRHFKKVIRVVFIIAWSLSLKRYAVLGWLGPGQVFVGRFGESAFKILLLMNVVGPFNP